MSTDRTQINRENATHSTGPRTPEGKERVKFNARRHNLSGQAIIGSDDDMAAYFAASARLKADFQPVGEFENVLVQSLADAQWQLDRARAMETNMIFGRGHRFTDPTDETQDFALDWAEGQAKTFRTHAKYLDIISRYATRYHRQVLQIHERLAKIQKDRKQQDYARNQERKRRHNEEFQRHQQVAAAGLTPTNQSQHQQNGFVSQQKNTTAQATEPTRAHHQKTLKEIAMEAIQAKKNQAA